MVSDSSSVGNIAWRNIDWSPDGKYLAFTIFTYSGGASTSTLHIWDLATNENLSLSTGSSSSVGDISWSPDGKYLAFTTSTNPVGSSTSTVQTSTAQVWVWDALTKARLSLSTYTYTGSGSPSASIDWSPDSKYLAFTTSTDSGGSSTSTVQTNTVQVWVWDALTKARLSIYTFTGSGSPSASIAWSPDGKYLAFTTSTDSGGSSTSTVQTNTVQVWDALIKARLSISTSTGSSSFGSVPFNTGDCSGGG